MSLFYEVLGVQIQFPCTKIGGFTGSYRGVKALKS